MTDIRIDLLADPKTRPTPTMSEAKSRATVGDGQQDEGPTVRSLSERVAALPGKPGSPSARRGQPEAPIAWVTDVLDVLATGTHDVSADTTPRSSR